MQQRIQNQLHKLKQLQLIRSIHYKQKINSNILYVDGNKYINFSSNDYLGFSQNKKIISASTKTLDKFGLGSTSSSWVSGLSSIHKNLNEEICKWLNAPNCILFSCGFMANLGVIESLCNRHDIIFHDKSNHASLITAVKLSKCKHYRYKHLDYNDLKILYDKHQKTNNWIISDAVFSMSGASADLSKIKSIQKNNCGLIIDDAHGIGILGKNGNGSFNQQNISYEDSTVHIITFGKALGAMGAAVVGNKSIIDYIQQSASTMAYTTAMPPAIAAGILEGIKLINTNPVYLQKLYQNINLFSEILKKHDLSQTQHTSPIFKINTKSITECETWSKSLKEKGIWVHPVKPPSVAISGMRIIINAMHTTTQLNMLGSLLNDTRP